jgi:hypothetical protein
MNTDLQEFNEPDPGGIGPESRQGPQVYLLHFSRPYKHARHYTSNGHQT